MEWHNVLDPNSPELDDLAARYKLHPLHVEDCRHRNQSAKIEEDRGYIFVVLKPVEVLEDGSLGVADLDIFLGRDFLITVPEGHCPQARQIVDKIRATAANSRPDQLFYRVIDGIVDAYLPALDHFNEVIDLLEDEVLERPSPDSLARIFDSKRNLIVLRRVLANTRDVAGHLQRTESELFQREMWPFLRDIYDHVARNLDMVEMQRDLLTGSLDIYLSSVANRTNQVMKVLTVLGTVALPVIVVSSFYGMNVKGLPWSESQHSIGILGGLMAGLTALLLIFLRLFHWF